MLTLNNKQVLIKSWRYAANYGPKEFWTEQSYQFGKNGVICLNHGKNVKEALEKAIVPINKKDAVLYFGKSSSFPRYKLTDTAFKRCIKHNKADYIVLGEIKVETILSVTIYEDSKYYYVIQKGSDLDYRASDADKLQFRLSPIKFITSRKLNYGEDFKKVYEGDVCYGAKTSGFEDYLKVLDGTYKNVIMDDSLDKIVNGSFESLDEDSLESLIDLLDSPDFSNRGLGLKLLSSYNVNEIPLTMRTIISLRPALKNLPEWKSTGMQQFLKTIDFRGFGNFPHYINYPIFLSRQPNEYSEKDRALCRKVFLKLCGEFINSYMDVLKNCKIIDIFDIKYNYEFK